MGGRANNYLNNLWGLSIEKQQQKKKRQKQNLERKKFIPCKKAWNCQLFWKKGNLQNSFCYLHMLVVADFNAFLN